MNKFTDFGFKKVKIGDKANLVKDVFDNVASKYDLMNDFMSAGLHRLWKDKMIEEINLKNNEKYNFIDVAGGTGDISFRIAKKFLKQEIDSKIAVVDINQEMLEYGKKRLLTIIYLNI